MIEIIPTLLTPAMLAMSPPATPAPDMVYDWKSQTAKVSIAMPGKDFVPQLGTMRGTQSFLGNKVTLDDWQQD